MSERKVLNKYYPPDFDPSKIPRMKQARNRQYTVRLMAPFNMRCKTCGEYIYKGKKFNARKEDVEGDDYLGIRIYRFYIKCTRCLQEISFKTDPKNTDYEIEAGATRNFMALKLAEEQAQREEDEEKEEEATNPMKLLEKRTLQSKQELELLESLEELKDLNRRQQTIDYEQMLEQFDTNAAKQRTEKEQEELDEQYIKTIFGKKSSNRVIVEEEIIEMEENKNLEPPRKIIKNDDDTIDRHKVIPKEKEVQIPTAATDCYKLQDSDTPSCSENTEASFNKRNLVLTKKKASLGVKVNTNVNVKESVKKHVNISEKNVANIDINCSENSGNSENTVSKLNNIGSGLSLLSSYTDSSENDSN